MIPEQDRQQSQADIETSSEKKELKEPASTFPEESAKIETKDWTQLCEDSNKEYAKSLVNFMLVCHLYRDVMSKRQ